MKKQMDDKTKSHIKELIMDRIKDHDGDMPSFCMEIFEMGRKSVFEEIANNIQNTLLNSLMGPDDDATKH
jgi:hypothetical protein